MVDEHLVRYIPRERIGLFIDGIHLLEAARALNVFIDYAKLLAHYQAEGQVVRALYYNALLPGRDATSGRALYEWLDYHAEGARIQWMFTTEKAREKLRKAYPIKES